mmetsp:Transcript_25107/g.81990  ORF Transcript_25107/g.81990 Transcript_25107/m.81990 type:complete len:229 (+) Transcript_25107:1-687(+)
MMAAAGALTGATLGHPATLLSSSLTSRTCRASTRPLRRCCASFGACASSTACSWSSPASAQTTCTFSRRTAATRTFESSAASPTPSSIARTRSSRSGTGRPTGRRRAPRGSRRGREAAAPSPRFALAGESKPRTRGSTRGPRTATPGRCSLLRPQAARSTARSGPARPLRRTPTRRQLHLRRRVRIPARRRRLTSGRRLAPTCPRLPPRRSLHSPRPCRRRCRRSRRH